MVERGLEESGVGGSNPSLTTMAHVKLYSIEESKERAKLFIDASDKFICIVKDDVNKNIAVQIGSASVAEFKEMLEAFNLHMNCLFREPV
jgi:hypothetical protein